MNTGLLINQVTFGIGARWQRKQLCGSDRTAVVWAGTLLLRALQLTLFLRSQNATHCLVHGRPQSSMEVHTVICHPDATCNGLITSSLTNLGFCRGSAIWTNDLLIIKQNRYLCSWKTRGNRVSRRSIVSANYSLSSQRQLAPASDF